MKTIKCENCNGEIAIDESRDFAFCMYCGTKIMLTERIKIDGMANVDNLIKKGFMNIGCNNYEIAVDAFQQVFSTDAENIYAMIGMMCAAESNQAMYFYKRVSEHSKILSPEERKFLDGDTCEAFMQAYVRAEDYARMDALLELYPHLEKHLLSCDSKSLLLARLMVRHGTSPKAILRYFGRPKNSEFVKLILTTGLSADWIFWHYGTKINAELLALLLDSGMNPNCKFIEEAFDNSHKYKSPLALALGIYNEIDLDYNELSNINENLEMAKQLLKRGADPNVEIPVYYSERLLHTKRRIRSCAFSDEARKLLADYGGRLSGLLGYIPI